MTALLRASRAFIRSLPRPVISCLKYLITPLYLSEVLVVLPFYLNPVLLRDVGSTLENLDAVLLGAVFL